MQIESLESRTFLSADGNTVTVPARYSLSGNLFANTAEGTVATWARSRARSTPRARSFSSPPTGTSCGRSPRLSALRTYRASGTRRAT